MLKGKTPLILALVLGALAGATAYVSLKRQQREIQAGWIVVPVLVASTDLPEGTVLTSDNVSQRAIPEQFVTSSVVKPDSAGYILGQKTLVPLQAGDPLVWTAFETSRASERLSGMVAQKMRAFTLDATGTKMSVGGWIRPNDHVDILGTFRDPISGEQVTSTLMQNLTVLAAGRMLGSTNVNLLPEGERQYSHLTFLVLPEEAEILSLATDLGSLTITLRNPGDADLLEDHGKTTIATLLTGVRQMAIRDKRIHTIEVLKATEKHDVAPR